MALEYVLVDNKLTPDPDDCSARVQNVRTVQMDEIVTRMTGRGLTLTDTEVKSVFNEFEHLLIELLHEGCAVTTPFMRVSPSIAGVFANADDVFDPARHAVRINASLGSSIVIDPRRLKVQKSKSYAVLPEIAAIKDYHSMQSGEVIKRGGTVEITGSELKVATEDKEQGIFIGNRGSEVRVSAYMMNKPSMLIFQVPQNISGGEVFITVRNKAKGGSSMRVGSYDKSLTVID